MKSIFYALLFATTAICNLNAQNTLLRMSSAQEPKGITDSVFRLDEVSVLGRRSKLHVTKVDVPITKLALSVNTLSGNPLELRGIQNIQDATRLIPGLNMRTSYGAFLRLSIRGFDNAPIYTDGLRDERTTINSNPIADLSDVRSIEVLKGPASVLYGQAAVGGILNIIRRDADGRQDVHASLRGGSFGHKQASMGFGGRFAPGFNYYTHFNTSGGDGWRSKNDKRFSGYGALKMDLGTAGEVDLRGNFNHDYYGTEIGLPPTMPADVFTAEGEAYLRKGQVRPDVDRASRYNSLSDFMYSTNWGLMGKYTKVFSSEIKLTQTLAYRSQVTDYFSMEELSYRESNDPIYKYYYLRRDAKSGEMVKRYIDVDSVYYSYPLRFAHNYRTVQSQTELSGKIVTGSMVHRYLGGYALSAMRHVFFDGYSVGYAPTGPGAKALISVLNPRSQGYVEDSFTSRKFAHYITHGFYLSDVVELTDKLTVMAAGRADIYDVRNYKTDTLSSPITEPRGLDMPAYGKYTGHQRTVAYTYRLGLVYEPIEGLSLYTSLANFFNPNREMWRKNTIYVDNQGNPYTPSENSTQIFKPTTGYQIELGVRYELADRLVATVSGFHIRQNNMVKTLGRKPVDVSGVTINQNIRGQIGYIDCNGFEVELSYSPLRNLHLRAGYGYNHARYSDGTKLAPELEGFASFSKGDQVNGIPVANLSSFGDYTIDRGIFSGLGFNYSVTYTGKTFRDYSAGIAFDPYCLLDLGLSYTLESGLTVGLQVRNVTNTKTYIQNLGTQLVPNEPISMLGSLSYRL